MSAKKKEMYTVTETITPEIAKRYLERNRNNRPVNQALVDSLAFDMLNGNYQMTEQGAAFDEDGYLVDAQHRLLAVVKSGVTIQMRVTRNAPGIDAVRDRGCLRSVSTFLLDTSGKRVAQPTRVSAICSALQHFLTGRESRPTVAMIRARLEDDRAGIQWVLDAVPARLPAFLQAAFVYAYSADPVVTAAFAERYVSLAELPAGSPVMALYRSISEMTHFRAAAKLDGIHRALRCIQLFGQGRKVQRIGNVEEALAHFTHLRNMARSSARTGS